VLLNTAVFGKFDEYVLTEPRLSLSSEQSAGINEELAEPETSSELTDDGDGYDDSLIAETPSASTDEEQVS
jgi:hypothetical protein